MTHNESSDYMPKRKLNIEEQISHMKNKGIKFNIVSEDQAKIFLSEHNYYFRIKAYAKNYDKYQRTNKVGQYINLEFAYLQELSIIDMHLRKIILGMVIDIEHFAKVTLLKDFNSNDSEDGYSIITKFLQRYPKIKNNMIKIKNKSSSSSYNRDLILKYLDEFAIWNIIETLTFDEFIKLYSFYYSESYELTESDTLESALWSSKFLRNAVAHNNCLLNSLKIPYSAKVKTNISVNSIIAQIPGISKSTRQKKMSNPVINDLISTIYLVDKIITSHAIKQHIFTELHDFIHIRFKKHEIYFLKNDIIKSTSDFLKKVIDYYYEKSI